jgi:cellulose synthase/poly-beta-1,6-N-acetylglucosamine synthase-like glycosyltransferase
MKNKIATYAICKNEQDYVEEWFENVKNSDYVVVLDTGSTDDT